MCEAKSEKLLWKPFLRQLLVISGVWTCYFMLGLCMGAPTVFVPQIRREANSSDAVSEEMASWLPAVVSYSGVPWIFILTIAMTFIGRKVPHAIACFTSFVGFTVLYFSQNVYHILASEILQGAITGSFMSLNVIIISEFTSSQYRGIFLTMKSATFFWGILASNTIGTFFHWKNIALLGWLCSSYSLATVLLWPESPFWLASRKRFDECAKSHRWLKGSDKRSEKELQRLITEYENGNIMNVPIKARVEQIIKILCSKEFIIPILYCILVLMLYVVSGKMVFTVYAIDIIKKMTSSEKTAYTGMLILDAITVFSMYVGCAITKLLKRRTLLLISSSMGIAFLLLTAFYLYLVKLGFLGENKYLSIFLLLGFSISIGCGPMILSTTISGELIPLHSRSLSICIIALTFKIIYGTFLKLAPYAFKTFGLHGTFLFFAISSSVCLLLIFIYLPETKDKTLQELNDLLIGKNPVEEAKELIPVGKANIGTVPSNRMDT